MATITEREKPLEAADSQVGPKVLRTKVLTWQELHRGDCQQDDAQLIFHSDGTGTFHCATKTYHTHSGDVWHASFSVKGSNGAVLFSTATFNSPRMNDGNPPPVYRWTAQFAYEPDYFDGISSAVQHCSC